MISQVKKELPWFYAVIEGDVRNEQLIGQQGFYVQRELLGDALEAVLQESVVLDDPLENVAPVYLSLVDESEMVGELNEGDQPELFVTDGLHVRSTEEGRSYQCPRGVVLTGWQPEFISGQSPRQGFVEEKSEAFRLEAQVSESSLLFVFTSLIRTLPSVSTLVVQLLDHYDSLKPIEKLEENVASIFTRPMNLETTLASLKSLKYLLYNGHLDFGISSKCSTIWLTEHKTIVTVTQNQEEHSAFRSALSRHLEKAEELLTLANGFSHFHYRPRGALSLKQLEAQLIEQSWKEES